MPVRVSTNSCFCVNDRDIPEDVIIYTETIRLFSRNDEIMFILGKQFCPASSLLKDNQVTAYLCSCTIRKEVVRQTDG